MATKEGSSKHFGKFEFWDDRYEKNQETFDWYQKYPNLRDIFTQYIKPKDIILNVGAGNSSKQNNPSNVLLGLSEDMYKDGFKYICNIDFSSTVAFQMQEYYKENFP